MAAVRFILTCLMLLSLRALGRDVDPLWDNDSLLPLENQVIKITGEMYDEMITSRYPGKPLNSVPWVLLFVGHYPTLDEAKYKMALDILARDYQGLVRFGWVDFNEEELLAATFEAMYIPQVFLIKDGWVHWYRDLPDASYVRNYIESERYKTSTTIFQ